MWGFPKIRGTILGVPIIRIIIFFGQYSGLPIRESTMWHLWRSLGSSALTFSAAHYKSSLSLYFGGLLVARHGVRRYSSAALTELPTGCPLPSRPCTTEMSQS